jgi:hypothetical protein
LFLREGVNVELEATNRLRDDPMTIIARQEHEARQHVLKNPVQMKQIKAKVGWTCSLSFPPLLTPAHSHTVMSQYHIIGRIIRKVKERNI